MNNYLQCCLLSEPSPGGPRTRSRHARRQAHISEDGGEEDDGLTDDEDMEEPAAAGHGQAGPEIVGKPKRLLRNVGGGKKVNGPFNKPVFCWPTAFK